MIAQRALLYFRDFMVIVACLLAGKSVAAILPFAFPGSIIGMLLLFVLLSLQLIKLHWVELGAGLLLRHMGVLFVPVAVGLVAWLEPLRQSFGVIMLCIVLGIVLILATVGRLYQRMNKMIFWLAIPLTLALYFATRALYRRLPWPIINPVLVPTAVIIGLLLWFDLPLEQYERGSSPITMLLEPAVVALALPLYQQARQIQAKLKPILICTLASVLISVCTTLLIGHFMGTDPALLASLATKSITTPLAMSVSQSIGGIPAIAAAVVVVVGIVGALIGYPLLKLLKVTDPEAQGLAMGACAHAIGTATSAEKGITQGAFASLAMVVCGILTAAVAPLLFAIYHWLI